MRFFSFRRAHWKRLCSTNTNAMDFLHGEVKRRVRSVGVFPDRASALRLIITVALKATGHWEDGDYLKTTLQQLAADSAATYRCN
ncbi:transposase [Myxococcus qinghaiensis]|uniref:transposase n=1 Tax=Myxococcus qinghaiensis TaxID=2906758 RepID=UPI0038995365